MSHYRFLRSFDPRCLPSKKNALVLLLLPGKLSRAFKVA
jgi:hypothetical protein